MKNTMGNDYMRFPSTQKELASEIKKACDNYFARKISNDDFTELLTWYASKFPQRLFFGDMLNPTITKVLGKKRCEIINLILEDFVPQTEEG